MRCLLERKDCKQAKLTNDIWHPHLLATSPAAEPLMINWKLPPWMCLEIEFYEYDIFIGLCSVYYVLRSFWKDNISCCLNSWDFFASLNYHQSYCTQNEEIRQKMLSDIWCILGLVILLNSTHFNEGFQQSWTITESSLQNSYLSFVVVKILKLTVNVRFQVISFLNAYCH